MSRKFLACIPTLLLGFLISNIAFSEGVLILERIPPIAGGVCDDYAYKEGQRLQAFIGTTIPNFVVTDAHCTSIEEFGDNDQKQWNVEISYDAGVRLPKVSTYDSSSIDRPGFSTLEDCQAVMPAEQATFKRLTKLNYFTSYCRVPLFRGQKYEVQIIGFGVTAYAPFSGSTEIFGSLIGHTTDTFTALVKSGLTTIQAELAQLTLTNSFSHITLAIRYYGTDRIRLENTTIAVLPTHDLCLAQVDATSAALKAAGVPNIGTFCQKAMFRNGYAELSSLTDDHLGVYFLNPNTLYDTYELCEAAKPAVIEHYKKDLKKNIQIGYCSSPSENRTRKFKIVMLEKR